MEDKRDWYGLQTALYDAVLEGDVSSLHNLLEKDPLILDRSSILKSDQFTQSPLHIAAILGHLEIVKLLSKECPIMCLSRNEDGRNSLHVAAIRDNRLDVVRELLEAQPQAARELTNQGESVLHLCVKYRNQDALEYLMDYMDDGELLNSRDSAGNTVLHLAVATRQPKLVRFLLGKRKMERDATNTNGFTAMDICLECEKNLSSNEGREITQSLKLVGAVRANVALKPQKKDRWNWLENKRNALMVVASLIATMSFQVGVNPIGGLWQDNGDQHNGSSPMMAPISSNDEDQRDPGSSIMATNSPGEYNAVLASTTVGLISSLSVLLLLISGLPYNRLFVFVLTITMWVAISATAITYMLSIGFLSSRDTGHATYSVLKACFISWLILMSLLLLAHVSRITFKLIKKMIRYVRRQRSWDVTRATSHRRLVEVIELPN